MTVLERRDVHVRVVVADDHRILREGLRRALEGQGIEVVGEAGDGDEAVELAGALRPDVVLMDVTMPVLDGVEATRRIRLELPDVRVVMLTMHADEATMARAIRAGADGYLVKDCTSDEIGETLRLVAAGQTAVSPHVAASMLREVQALPSGTGEEIVSKREEEVLQLIADGCSSAEVAQRLYISQKTVKNHLASIYHSSMPATAPRPCSAPCAWASCASTEALLRLGRSAYPGPPPGADHLGNNGGPTGARNPKENLQMIFKTEAIRNFLNARFAQAERGAALVEYALLVALIAVVSIFALQALGGGISKKFKDVDTCIATPDAAVCKTPTSTP
ncbi:MAG: response regulator [Actinomycetota bacterium]|nr:response regulator [Actinomycetota bacterium]